MKIAQRLEALPKRHVRPDLPARGKDEAREPLLVDAADDEVKDYHRIHGQRIAAPARTKNAELKPVNVEGRFESRKVAHSRHHANANHPCGHSDSLANAVDGQVTLDSVGFFPWGSPSCCEKPA